MKTLSSVLELKTIKTEFKGIPVTAILTRAQTKSLAPYFHFFVTMGKVQFFLNRASGDRNTWIGGEGITRQDCQVLGPLIEEKMGHLMPHESNNPFEYEGEIEIKKEEFYLRRLKVIRAKAPYSRDRYYRIEAGTIIIELIKYFSWTEEGQWLLNTNNMLPERFTQVTKLIDKYEAKNGNG